MASDNSKTEKQKKTSVQDFLKRVLGKNDFRAHEKSDSNATEEVTTYIPEIVSDSSSNLPQTTDRSRGALTTVDPMAAYLAEVKKYPLLTKQQEHEIAIKYHETQDPKLAEILVTSNLRFVLKIAAEYSKFGARMIDLVQEGNVGLMQAVKSYNPYKGVRLITYAVWWIRGYIQEYLMKQYSLVKIGTTQNQRKLFYQLQKEINALEKLGESGDYKKIAQSLDVPEHEVQSMSQRLTGKDVSLNVEIDESGRSLMDLQQDEDQELMDEQLNRQEELSFLEKNLIQLRPQLNERELFLLDHRLLADQPMTLQDIGDKYGVTREAVRQMEARLMNKIQKGYKQMIEGASEDNEN